jgi:hypothetical protein
MLSWVVTYRNHATGEMRPFLVKAVGKMDALDLGQLALGRDVGDYIDQDPWELFSVNRSEP